MILPDLLKRLTNKGETIINTIGSKRLESSTIITQGG